MLPSDPVSTLPRCECVLVGVKQVVRVHAGPCKHTKAWKVGVRPVVWIPILMQRWPLLVPRSSHNPSLQHVGVPLEHVIEAQALCGDRQRVVHRHGHRVVNVQVGKTKQPSQAQWQQIFVQEATKSAPTFTDDARRRYVLCQRQTEWMLVTLLSSLLLLQVHPTLPRYCRDGRPPKQWTHTRLHVGPCCRRGECIGGRKDWTWSGGGGSRI